MTDQIPFGTDNFAENPEPRCPCVLLLDTSGSMAGQPIAALNAGLVTLVRTAAKLLDQGRANSIATESGKVYVKVGEDFAPLKFMNCAV